MQADEHPPSVAVTLRCYGAVAVRNIEGDDMRALVLQAAGQLGIHEVPDLGEPGPGQVKIAPHTVGICGSDVHYFTHGRIGKYVVEAPMILGHEASGVVTAVGQGVTHLSVGDRVAMEPGIPHMSSRAAKIGMYNVDPSIRFWATPPVDGCLAQEVIHPAAFTYRLPDSVSFAAGAMVEPLAVAMHAVTKSRLAPGEVVVVMGGGTIGLLSAAVARAAGASKVVVADISETKLHSAARIGGVITVNTTVDSIVDAVNDCTGGWGADVVIEASGALPVYDVLWKLGAPGNRTLLIGIPSQNPPIDMTEVQERETQILPVFRYANVYEKAIDLLASGRLDVHSLVSRTYPFDEAVAAFERAAEAHPQDIKIQITLR